MSGYDFIYQLKPVKESESEPGWWKLRWRPIKMGTYNIYCLNNCSRWRCKLLGFRFYEANAHNGWGWGRRWDEICIEIGLFFITINFWIRWNISVMECGPQDVNEKDKKPLNIKEKK